MTSKELARILGLSETAVSFALNNKPGVSTQTRNRVKEAALTYGLDTSKMNLNRPAKKVYLFYYKKDGAVLGETSFFSELTSGVESRCHEAGFIVNILNIYSAKELETRIRELHSEENAGIIVFGTEMKENDFYPLAFARIPLVLLDNHFISTKIDSVKINNFDGAYSATKYLITHLKTQPGYLHSSYSIYNFEERADGFYRALRESGMARSNSIVHELSPSSEGAYSDMRDILQSGEPIASSYFADNDLIAIGAMKAMKEYGLKIPDDVSIIAFDDIQACSYTEPALSTVHVPKKFMGIEAVNRLIACIEKNNYFPVNVEISTCLVLRESIRHY